MIHGSLPTPIRARCSFASARPVAASWVTQRRSSSAFQTSADSIYIFHAVGDTPQTQTLRWDGRDWPIERMHPAPFCLLDVTLHPYLRAEANS